MKDENPVDLTTINLDSLASFKKNDYLKLLKKPTSLKKKKAVIFITKYKFPNGKLPIVVIPYKKLSDAKKDFKDRVKKDKKSFGGNKFILLAEMEVVKEDDGNITIEASPISGGADIEMAAAKLFSKMKMGFRLTGEPTSEQLEVRKEKEQELSPEKLEQLAKKKARRLARYAKISENLSKIETAFAQTPDDSKKQTLEANIQKMEEALAQMLDEALEDGEIDAEEQAEIDVLEEQLALLKGDSDEEEEELDLVAKKEKAKIRMAKMDEEIAKLQAFLKIA
jgi:hypothetical protein